MAKAESLAEPRSASELDAAGAVPADETRSEATSTPATRRSQVSGTVLTQRATLIARDWGADEGEFCNFTGSDVVVAGDSRGRTTITGRVVPNGSCGKGDAVIVPDLNGEFTGESVVFKVPNRTRWRVFSTARGEMFGHEYRGYAIAPLDLANPTLWAARIKNGSDTYSTMSVGQFLNKMGKRRIEIEGGTGPTKVIQ
jgi:hypothetical protein